MHYVHVMHCCHSYTLCTHNVLLQPTLVHLWLNPSGPRSFFRSVMLCGFTSFMFGWHVHEKAILLVIIPLILLSMDSPRYCKNFVFLSITGHVSLFPLIYTHFGESVTYTD